MVFIYLGSLALNSLFAQPIKLLPQPGKVFISKAMQDLEILSDSTLVTSIQNSDHKSIYKIKNDTLFIKEAYTWYGPNNSSGYTVIYNDYKIIRSNGDTVILKNNYHGQFGAPDDWENPLVFINIEKIKQSVNNFKYLKMSSSNPFKGSVEVTIDSTGKVSYFRDSATTADFALKVQTAKKTVQLTGSLSPLEFENFKNILSKSMITLLPELRGCGIDEPQTWFTVTMNNKTFTTKGCKMYNPQQLLFNYLYVLDNNNGVENRRQNE